VILEKGCEGKGIEPTAIKSYWMGQDYGGGAARRKRALGKGTHAQRTVGGDTESLFCTVGGTRLDALIGQKGRQQKNKTGGIGG